MKTFETVLIIAGALAIVYLLMDKKPEAKVVGGVVTPIQASPGHATGLKNSMMSSERLLVPQMKIR